MSLHDFGFGDLLREHARSWPATVALVCDGARHDYRTLDGRVNRLANALSERGVGAGGRVLWLGQNCHRLIETMLAAAKLGAGLCPVNWRQSANELSYVISDFAPQVVVWQSQCEVASTFTAAREAARHDAAWIDADGDYEAVVEAAAPDDPGVDVDPLAPLLYMYTAAFSGRPRAAMLSHQGLLTQGLAIAAVQEITPGYVYLNCGPLFHIATFMTTAATLELAGTNVFTPRVDAEEICRLVDAEKVVGAFLLPQTVSQIAEVNADRRYDLSTLVTMHMGNKDFRSMISPASSTWLRKPGGYGQTEVTGLLTLSAYGAGPMAPGRPGPFAAVRIVDEDGNDVPDGATGEIVAKGPLAMVGYWGDDEETARRQRGGWHHTNDLGRREPDGTVTFVGPKTELIKTGVENVYPAEVESALQQHPAVAEVVVIGVPDPVWDQNVKAVVRLHDGQAATADELIEHVKGLLASYKKPKSVDFVDAFPRLESGWIDRDAVKAAHGAGGTPGTG
ncbi:MAG TPA: AMP-binding protein [Mycobacteriales bacterium]|nr:AMP-binding protein [Mycobacteriales bacterium]